MNPSGYTNWFDRVARGAAALGAALALSGAVAPVQAAEVQPLRESYLDAIFSQQGFGNQTIDIRFNPAQTIYGEDWLVIDVDKGFPDDGPGAIWGLTQAGGLWNTLTIPLFYVDAYLEQGLPATSTLGLAWVSGNGVTLRADFQADLPLGGRVGPAEQEAHAWRAATVVAHELGHNLGLSHLSSFETNLMDAVIGLEPSSLLTPQQIATVLSSPYVQTDTGGQRFISITPFALLAAPVPEPGTWALMGAGLLVMGVVWRRRSP